MCVILTTNESITDDPTLVDKEAILCSLNIKTMSFQALTDVWKSSPKRTLLTLSLLRGGTFTRHLR
jgi:potassium large conductance calcium-activated channel subfamily M alpha protein 1